MGVCELIFLIILQKFSPRRLPLFSLPRCFPICVSKEDVRFKSFYGKIGGESESLWS